MVASDRSDRSAGIDRELADAVAALLDGADEHVDDPVSYGEGVRDASGVARALFRRALPNVADPTLRGRTSDPDLAGRIAASTLREVGDFLERSAVAHATGAKPIEEAVRVLENAAGHVNVTADAVEHLVATVLFRYGREDLGSSVGQ